jgi:D-aspartate ligase
MLPAIVISSHTVGLGVTRALGVMGVPIVIACYDHRDMGYVSKYVKEVIDIPHPEHDEKLFIRKLVQCHDRMGRALVVPADDASLMVVSRNKNQLSNYFLVACPDHIIIEKSIDKKHTYSLAERLGIPAPKTITPSSDAELEHFATSVEFPCLIKPCQSHLYFEKFGCKMIKVNTIDQLLAAYRNAKAAKLEVMVQEYIPGDETLGVNYNSYFWNGEPLVEFTATKVRMSPPEFGIPSVVVSRKVQEVLEPGRKFLQGLGYYGYSCTEFKLDPRDGIYKLLEVNGRHNRSALLAVHCGINFPWLEYCHLVDGRLPAASGFREGTYWIDEFHDLNRCARQLRREHFPVLKYLTPYLGRHIFSVFDWRDTKPFCLRCSNLVKSALAMLVKAKVDTKVAKPAAVATRE